MESRDGTDEYLQGSSGDREQTYGHGWGKKGEAGTDGESGMEAYTTVCKIRQSVGMCCDSGNSNQRTVTTQRVEGGSGGRGHMYTVADSC